MRPIVAAVLLMACDARVAQPPDACASELGTLRVCIYMDASSTMTIGGSVTARRDPTDVPWLIQIDADGCATDQIEVGAWDVTAIDSSGTCTVTLPAEVRACEVTELRAEVISGCVDG